MSDGQFYALSVFVAALFIAGCLLTAPRCRPEPSDRKWNTRRPR